MSTQGSYGPPPPRPYQHDTSGLEVRIARLESMLSAVDSWSRTIDQRLHSKETEELKKLKETIDKLVTELEIVKGVIGL